MARKKRKDGRYSANITVSTANGKRRRKFIYADTQKELNEKIAALKAEQAQGRDISAKAQTVAQFLQHWLETVVAHRNKPRTIASYTDMVTRLIAPHIGHHLLDKLTPQHVQAMLTTLATEPRARQGNTPRPLSARTVQYARAILRRALTQALKWRLVSQNVAALTDAPRVERPTIPMLTAEQARQFLATVEGHRLATLYHVALTLGLRQGELIALTWEDVDLERATLRVQASKTAAGVRTLPLPPALVSRLRQHCEPQGNTAGLVFPSEAGTPLTATNLIRHFKATLEAAGLPEVRFHSLRHLCATLLVEQDVHPKVVQEILGHSSFTITMDIYAKATTAPQRAALEGLSTGLQGDEGGSGSQNSSQTNKNTADAVHPAASEGESSPEQHTD